MPRKCENWIEDFLRYTMPVSQCPESFLRFSGLFALAAALRRHVAVDRAYLGGWECQPHLYVILHGDAAVGKSTALRFAEDLLDQVPTLTKGPDEITGAALKLAMSESPDFSLFVAAGEMEDLINKDENILRNTISLFDGKKTHIERTIKRDVVTINNPCLNFAACTTPESISEKVSKGLMNGGWGSRIIFVHETQPRQKRFFYKGLVLDYDRYELEANLVEDLNHIAETIRGKFEIADDALEWLENWFLAGDVNKVLTKVKGYLGRRHVHALKIAMLLHVSYSDELVLTLEDVKNAVATLETIEPKMAQVFSHVGRNVYSMDVEGIREYIADKQKVKRSELLRQFKAMAEPQMLEALIKNMIDMEIITSEFDGGHIYYVSR